MISTKTMRQSEMAPACGEVGSGVLSGVGHMTPRFAFPETHGAVQHEVVATVFAAHSSLLHFHRIGRAFAL